MKKISIYTLTMGRWFYLENTINSIEYDDNMEHFIVFQGVTPPEDFKKNLDKKQIIPIFLEKNIGNGLAMNMLYPKFTGDIIMRLDDDAKIVSSNFFAHVRELNRLVPKLVFSPYPVGLINNPGGVPSKNHQVGYSNNTDTYYTLRITSHLGGLARISPREFTGDFVFEDDFSETNSGCEDVQHARLCTQGGIPMAYLENCLIVEHQESTLGQHKRYGKEYFKNRF